jgi:hypothetical protein
MSTRDALLISEPSRLPEAVREPIEGVSFAAYLVVEAARLDGLPFLTVLGWLGVRQRAFARAEELWSERVSDELAREGAHFDEVYEDLLTQALSLWARSIEPLDREVEAWMTFQRHALAAEDPGAMARRAGLTVGDEMRLARLWRGRLATAEIAARAMAAWSGPLLPLPKLSLSPIVFPPTPEPL